MLQDSALPVVLASAERATATAPLHATATAPLHASVTVSVPAGTCPWSSSRTNRPCWCSTTKARALAKAARLREVTSELQPLLHAIAKEAGVSLVAIPRVPISTAPTRSEEHTSELQSREN